MNTDNALFYIVSSNFITVVALIYLLFLVIKNPFLVKNQTRLFIISVSICLFMIVNMALDHYFSLMGRDSLIYIARRITSFFNFAVAPVIPICLYRISEKKSPKLWYYIPLLINCAVCFASMFHKIVFFISPRNTYGRGVLFPLPVTTSLFYLVILILTRISVHLIHSKRIEQFFLISAILVIVASLLLEIFGGYKFMSWNTTAVCLLVYYYILNFNGFVLDPLTGAYNRSKFIHDTSADKLNECMIVSIDINNFKRINDEFGHDAGDILLKKFVDIVHKNLTKYEILYRIGGDEFIIISKNINLTHTDDIIQKCKNDCLQSDLSFAYGKIKHSADSYFEETIKRVDALMYENKSAMKN